MSHPDLSEISDDYDASSDEGEIFDHQNPKRITRQLNISKSYVRGWGTREAFREFYQNWKDAIIETFDLKGRFRATFEENEKFINITVPAADHTRENPSHLGLIQFEKRKGEVILVNANAKLQPKHLQLGNTSKDTRDDLAGCHGEGFKIAAMVMMRAGHKVRIRASNHNWNFGFRGPTKSQFYCTISPSRKKERSSSGTASPPKTLSGFKYHIESDVAIIVDSGPGNKNVKVESEVFLKWLSISLDIVGFSQPSDAIETPFGDLILDANFANKIYLKGLLLPESGSELDGFQYGYNFTHGRVNRDRERLTNSNDEARLLNSVWKSAIRKNHETILPRYVSLLFNKPDAPDIREASRLVTWDIAKKVWRHLRKEAGDSKFYYWNKQDKDVELIKDSLKKSPVGLPEILWEILRRHKLIRTPEEERIEQFRNAQESTPPDSNFSKTIEKTLKASLMMNHDTADIQVVFVDCRHSDIEVYFESDTKILKISKEWLDCDAIHKKHECDISELRNDEIKNDLFFCDHIALSLFELAAGEISKGLHIKQDWSNKHRQKFRKRILRMPRDITLKQSSKGGELIVSWEDGETEQHSKYFGDKVEYYVILHHEKCRPQETHSLHNHCDSNTKTAPCGCSQKFVSQREKMATFGDLVHEQSYFAMVAHNDKDAILGISIESIQPKEYLPLSIDDTAFHHYDEYTMADVGDLNESDTEPLNDSNKFGLSDSNATKENVTATTAEDSVIEEKKKFWEQWQQEDFPKIFNMCTPQDVISVTYTRPLPVYTSQKLNWTFKAGDYISVTMKNSLEPDGISRHVLRLHGVYPDKSPENQSGNVLATKYSFLRRSHIFRLEDSIERQPDIDGKELLLHFRDIDLMGHKRDASLVSIEDITDVKQVSRDLLGSLEQVQYTTTIPDDITSSGLFCRFAVKCGGPVDSACLMPVINDLLPLSKHRALPQYYDDSRPVVFDLSPSVVGLAEGFRQAGYTVNAGLGFDPSSDFTWKARHPSASVYDGNLDSILVDFKLKYMNMPPFVIQGIPKIAILSIPDMGLKMRDEQINEGTKILENINMFFDLYPEKIDVLVFAFPVWIFYDNAFLRLFQAMHKMLQNGYCVHLKKVSLSDHGLPQDRTVIILVAMSFCSPIQWEAFFDQQEPIEKKLPQQCIGDLQFNNPRVTEDGDTKAFVCKSPGGDDTVYNHQTGRRVPGSKAFDFDSIIDMRHGPSWLKRHMSDDVLTVRELARIQGFCDNFVFYGTVERQYEEVMQAFPPPIAKKLAHTMLASLREYGSWGETEEGSDRGQKRRRGE